MLKRIMDWSGAILGLLFLSPFFLLIAIGIKLTSNGPVFFRQERVGLHGQTFQILKFRSMTAGDNSQGSQVTSRTDSRITPLGHFLRRHKLDEYPQLINVLLGQMSLVGPRPEVPRYVALYPNEFKKVFLKKPGMTHRVSLMLRHEEEILADSSDPESMYVQTVLPWKLGLYLNEQGSESVFDDFLTVIRTVLSRRLETSRPAHPLDAPLVANVPAFPDHIEPRPVAQRQPQVVHKEAKIAFVPTGTEQS